MRKTHSFKQWEDYTDEVFKHLINSSFFVLVPPVNAFVFLSSIVPSFSIIIIISIIVAAFLLAVDNSSGDEIHSKVSILDEGIILRTTQWSPVQTKSMHIGTQCSEFCHPILIAAALPHGNQKNIQIPEIDLLRNHANPETAKVSSVISQRNALEFWRWGKKSLPIIGRRGVWKVQSFLGGWMWRHVVHRTIRKNGIICVSTQWAQNSRKVSKI